MRKVRWIRNSACTTSAWLCFQGMPRWMGHLIEAGSLGTSLRTPAVCVPLAWSKSSGARARLEKNGPRGAGASKRPRSASCSRDVCSLAFPGKPISSHTRATTSSGLLASHITGKHWKRAVYSRSDGLPSQRWTPHTGPGHVIR